MNTTPIIVGIILGLVGCIFIMLSLFQKITNTPQKNIKVLSQVIGWVLLSVSCVIIGIATNGITVGCAILLLYAPLLCAGWLASKG